MKNTIKDFDLDLKTTKNNIGEVKIRKNLRR